MKFGCGAAQFTMIGAVVPGGPDVRRASSRPRCSRRRRIVLLAPSMIELEEVLKSQGALPPEVPEEHHARLPDIRRAEVEHRAVGPVQRPAGPARGLHGPDLARAPV